MQMQYVFVLVHSPSVGPLTWTRVADRLRVRGQETIVPALLDVADAGPPFWPRLVEDVAKAMSQLDPHRPVLLVAHSNAGLFVPLLVTHAVRPVHGCIFVDAALPPPAHETPVAPAELLDFLRSKATNGRLPPWTEWWDEEDVAPMFPDPQTRAAVTAEQPRLPLAYYEQMVPVPVGWDNRPCGYLLFGPPYDEMAADARRRGWLVDELPGQHLHQVVDPVGVADRLIAMAQRLAVTGA
jgi:hypothetical protein